MITLRQTLTEAYLDALNNYLTVEKWAEANGLYLPDAIKILEYARIITNQKHQEA